MMSLKYWRIGCSNSWPSKKKPNQPPPGEWMRRCPWVQLERPECPVSECLLHVSVRIHRHANGIYTFIFPKHSCKYSYSGHASLSVSEEDINVAASVHASLACTSELLSMQSPIVSGTLFSTQRCLPLHSVTHCHHSPTHWLTPYSHSR